MFREESEVELDPPSQQEWTISPNELTFGKKIVDHPTHSIFTGKWHGDVIIHTFNITNSKAEVKYKDYVKDLINIRHENIVSFMGTSFIPMLDLNAIITNPVRALSLRVKRTDLAKTSIFRKMDVTCQVR